MTPDPKPPKLQELQALAMLADGDRLAAVGKALGARADTVYRRLKRVCDDYGVATSTALVALAVEHGWIVRTFEGWIVPDPGAPKPGGGAA